MTYTSAIFVVVLLASIALFVYFLVPRVRYLLLGSPEPRVDQVARRTGGLLILVFGQKKLLKEPAGIVHLVIFWGFIVIALGTLQIVGEGLREGFLLPLIGDSTVFYLLKDILSVLVLVGVIVAAYVRYVMRPARLRPNLEAGVILALIFALIVTEFLYSGISYGLGPDQSHSLAFMTVSVSGLWDGVGATALEATRDALWWLHVIVLLGFLVYIPVSKHLHLVACPFNEWLRDLRPRGAQISSLDFEDENIEEFGVGRVAGFTKKQLLDLYACAECGRCQDNCPAYRSGKSLSPKLLMTKLRDHLVEQGPRLLRKAEPPSSEEMSAAETAAKARVETAAETQMETPVQTAAESAVLSMVGDVITTEETWACTTCCSCQEQCPVMNEHINKIIDMRRNLVLTQGELPHEAVLVFRNMEVNGNPLGESALVRGDHLRKLGVATIGEKPDAEILYWPGCSGAFDARNQKVSEALVTLAESAGASLATLGNEEKCCGEAARRLGNEYLYQTLAAGNIEKLNSHGVKRIVTQCPPCFNTLKNEYPQMGADFEVLHHTQFISELIDAGRLTPRLLERRTAAYHDACYLGRYNGIYELPRQLLRSAGLDLVKIPHDRTRAFCCGAGGGRMWLDEKEGERINNLRTDELLSVSPDIAAVACPYCLIMLKDGVDARGADDSIQVMDIAEILQQAVLAGQRPGGGARLAPPPGRLGL